MTESRDGDGTTDPRRSAQHTVRRELERALERADDPEVRYHIRQALQLLME